jgi:hypothetical protein
MKSLSRRALPIFVTLLVSAMGQNKPRWRPLPSYDVNMKTGPNVGTKLPDFRAQDQTGTWRTLSALLGPKGLMLVIIRSADW